MAASAYTVLQPNEGKQYEGNNALAGRTVYAFLYTVKSIAKGDLDDTLTLASGYTEASGGGYARQAVVLGSISSAGVIVIPGYSFTMNASGGSSVCTGVGLASASVGGVAIMLWDHMRVASMTSTSTTLTVTSSSGLANGMNVYGVGIQTGTTIASPVTSSTQVILSASATQTQSGVNVAFSFDMSANGASFTVPSLSAFYKNPWE